MNAMRESWTDERLDDLNGRVGELSAQVDRGFALAHRDLESHRVETRGEFVSVRGEIKAGFEGIHRLIIQVGGVLVASLIGVIAALLGTAS